jgi:hypothetical protein
MTEFGAPPGSFPEPPRLPPIPPGPPIGPARTGPPWEQVGAPALQRFIDTMKGVLLDPATTFRNMRREGGLGAPLIYLLIGVIVNALASALWQGLLGGMMMGPLGTSPFGDSYGLGAFSVTWLLFVFPIILICWTFIWTACVHGLLMLFGGQKFPYETTFRTIAYAWGSTYPIGIVPICGGAIAFVWSCVASIIGLAQTQETTMGKAAAAVLVSLVLCCALLASAVSAGVLAGLGLAGLGSRW